MIVEIIVQRDSVAERAVFSGCDSGAVCITSYQQCAKSEIFKLEIVWILIGLLF